MSGGVIVALQGIVVALLSRGGGVGDGVARGVDDAGATLEMTVGIGSFPWSVPEIVAVAAGWFCLQE